MVVLVEDLEIMMEDIFGEIHLEGKQIDTAPPTVAEEGTDAEAAVVEEITSD